MPKIEYPECGRIINTHGCYGGIKVEPWCDTPRVCASLPTVYFKEGAGFRAVKVKKASVFRNFVFMELDGITTMEQAQALYGTVLYAAREDLGLADGVLLVAELIGLPVFDANSGERLGTVKDVIHPAANDIYVIDTPKGEAMVPAVAEFLRSVDLENGLLLTPIEGMFP